MNTSATVLHELRNSLPPGVIMTPEQIAPIYLGDWVFRNEDAQPGGLALPRSTEEVSAIVQWAYAHECPVVPPGGRTGSPAALHRFATA